MTVNEALDEMRKNVTGCNLVAFADLSSRLVLSSSAAGKPGREEMDALSEAAYEALDGGLAEGASPVLGSKPASMAMLMTSNEARIILRSPEKPSEALVCVCDANVDVAKVLDSGHAALDQIAAGAV